MSWYELKLSSNCSQVSEVKILSPDVESQHLMKDVGGEMRTKNYFKLVLTSSGEGAM